MTSNFKLDNVYDKNLNILIGAGASVGLFPTLALGIKDSQGNSMTIESLATHLTKGKDDPAYTALFMYYYKKCIEPVLIMDYAELQTEAKHIEVLENYVQLIQTILNVLYRKKSGEEKTCNIFTTNYDGCLAYAADHILQNGSLEFHVNDGTSGFKRRILHARNFSTHLTQTGAFGRHRHDLAQINLIQMHGSAYWSKVGDRIQIDYSKDNQERLVSSTAFEKIQVFSSTLENSAASVNDLPIPSLSAQEISDFWTAYDALPIVNPTKWKFHETVFEEHYYQMLRYLSYELERKGATLIAFGFSFADEHIRNLIKRSISNPYLEVFICCFNVSSKEAIDAEFGAFANVQTLILDVPLNFTAFNTQIFALPQKILPQHSTQAEAGK